MHTRLKITLTGVAVAGAIVGATAMATTPKDNSLDPSRIIPSLTATQTEKDKLPPPTLAMLAKDGKYVIDPAKTRFVGESPTLRFYAAPADSGICLIPVNAEGEGPYVGCVELQGFESNGLQFQTPDGAEGGWLVVSQGAAKALDSVKDEAGWSQQAPNFLVQNNR